MSFAGQGEGMMRGNIRGLVGFLVIGALVAMRYHAAEAAAIDGNSGTIVLRGAVSESQPSGPIGEGAPVVLRGSPSQHPQPAPERSDCDPSHYYDPDRGCVVPEAIYSPDYGYW